MERFYDGGTREIFNGLKTRDARRALPVTLHGVAQRKLGHILTAARIRDLAFPVGNNLEALRGDREGQYSIRINAQYRICFVWTEQSMSFAIPIPTNRKPTKPGEVILEDFLKPLGITQQQLADALHISRVRINEILNGRRSITPDTAMRLEKVLGSSAQMWLNLQMVCDLYETQHSPTKNEIKKLKQLVQV